MNDKIKTLSLLISRLLAFLMDLIILLVLFSFLKIKGIEPIKENLLFVSLMVLLVFQSYFFLFELIFSQTPGKFVFGLMLKPKKVSDEERKSTLILRYIFDLFIRNFSRTIILFPPLFLLNEILILIFFKGKSFSEVISGLKVDFKN